jgi:hypothetical protein
MRCEFQATCSLNFSAAIARGQFGNTNVMRYSVITAVLGISLGFMLRIYLGLGLEQYIIKQLQYRICLNQIFRLTVNQSILSMILYILINWFVVISLSIVFLTSLSQFTCFRGPPGRRENRRLESVKAFRYC